MLSWFPGARFDDARRVVLSAARILVCAAHIPGVKLRYTYRLRPGVAAERGLWQEEGRNRWVWNQAVAARKAGKPKFDDKALTATRREHDWLREGSSVAAADAAGLLHRQAVQTELPQTGPVPADAQLHPPRLLTEGH